MDLEDRRKNWLEPEEEQEGVNPTLVLGPAVKEQTEVKEQKAEVKLEQADGGAAIM